jgi:poly(glycerol-phosphate) alpha-glucosyltransferase
MSTEILMLPGSVSRKAGGLFTSVRRLSESIHQFDDTVVSVVGHRDEHTEEDISSWKTSPHLLKSSKKLDLSNELAALLSARSPSLIHTQFIWSYASHATIQWKKANKGCPHVISPRGMLDPWAIRNSAWKKRIAAFLFESRHLRSAACIHALCQSEAHSIRKLGLKVPVCIIPNGIDLPDDTFPSSHEPLNLKKSILFLGRIHPKKGLRELIQAWSLARASLPDWDLLIGGWDEGGHLEELKTSVLDYQLSDSIHFLGPLHGRQKAQQLQMADAFILPSFSEGLPMAVLEAWSYKTPVLMTSECNLPEGFDSNSAACISNTPKTLAGQLKDFARVPETQRNSMGVNGRKLVVDKFQWTRIASQMKAVYDWILGERQRPACVFEYDRPLC